jgi:F-type H+-transporting ATPase subunit O
LSKILQGQKYTSLTVNTFAALAENGRLNKVNGVLSSFSKIMSAHRGEVMCTVTSAKPLEQGHLKELKGALEAFLQKGETLQLETKVDPGLIGGMVVTIGDKYIDMSMATKIKTYTNLIRQAV